MPSRDEGGVDWVEHYREHGYQLLNYVHHDPGCAYEGGNGECDCGLAELERVFDIARPEDA
jgi:hypothetical protein